MDNEDARMVSNDTIIEVGNECTTDIEAMEQGSKLENEINKMLDELKPPPSFERCIYRVPSVLRKGNEEAYTPRTVSIGPFHHNNKNLESMEEVKERYMKKLVRMSGNSSLKKCIDFVKKSEAKIRDCYAERIEMGSDELVKIILVNSCFIIQFFISVYDSKEYKDYNSLFIEPMMLNNICLDLILLENQVLFFVLEELCSLATSKEYSILGLALQFFEEYRKCDVEHNFQSLKHFTHLVLILYRPLPRERLEEKSWSCCFTNWVLIHRQPPPREEKFRTVYSLTNLTVYSLTNLIEAGVRLREKRTSEGLFDITFTNGVLEIPKFTLADSTEVEIRNLMALEALCENPGNMFVTDYFIFMDWLINTTRDVDLLVHEKIIINNLGSNDEATTLINKLCTNASYDGDNFYFYQVVKRLNSYYETPTHRLKAMLKHDYFHTPWRTASTIAAIMLLVLTFIQTVCVRMHHHHHHHPPLPTSSTISTTSTTSTISTNSTHLHHP